jgi:hypothetical protein
MADTEQPPQDAPKVEVTSDQDALKSNFNASLQAEEAKTAAPVVEVKDPPAEKPKAADSKEAEPAIPAEFLTAKKDKAAEAEEPLVDEATRANIPKGKASESFKKLETISQERIKALKQEIAELRSKPATAANPEVEANYKKAQEDLAALTQKLERVAYTESPRFQKFGTEEKAELDSAKNYLQGTEINPAHIEAAASATGAARVRILRDAGMDAETIAVVGPHLARIDSLRRERDASIATWRETADQERIAQQRQAQQQEEHRISEEKRVYTETMGRLGKLPAFTKSEGHEKWNALVEANAKEAEDFAFGKKSLPELFELGIRGVAQKTTELMNQELTRQLNDTRAEVARLKAAQPTVGSAADAPLAKAKTGNEKQDEQEHYKNSFNTHLAAARG